MFVYFPGKHCIWFTGVLQLYSLNVCLKYLINVCSVVELQDHDYESVIHGIAKANLHKCSLAIRD